jgi:hypothetical protein
MNETHDGEVIRLLQRLGELQPTPEATRIALDRARQALVSAPAVIQMPSRWRIRLRRYLAAAAVLLVAGGVSAWLFVPAPAPASAGFVQVRNAMKVPVSITYRQINRVRGEQEVVTRLLILHQGLWRAERSDGSYTIMDVDQHRVLSVYPLKREALVLQGLYTAQNNLYESITRLANNSSARALPGKKMYGTEVQGYTVTVQGRKFTVWASAKTQLPVRIEVEGKDDLGRNCEIIIDQFGFGRELDKDLFSFRVPPGFKQAIKGVAEMPAAPEDAGLRDLIVTPNVGLGPVEFGMTASEVEKLLGKPDEIDENKPGNSILNYGSRGFSVQASKANGVWAISCVAQAAMVTRVRDFSGQTDKGLMLGDSAAQVVALYGEPDSTEMRRGSKYMVYDKLQAHFWLFEDKLVQIWIGRAPAK